MFGIFTAFLTIPFTLSTTLFFILVAAVIAVFIVAVIGFVAVFGEGRLTGAGVLNFLPEPKKKLK